MSKEIWIKAYELNLYDGMSEHEAIEKADDRAASMQADLADMAMDREWEEEKNDSSI